MPQCIHGDQRATLSSLLPSTPSSSRKGTQVVKLRQQATPLVSQLATQNFF